MEELDLREAIYDRLGLEFGSLPSESGNDWQRAKDEVLEEKKQLEFEKLQQLKKIDYTNIDKNSEEYKIVMNSKSLQMQVFHISISSRNDLTNEDIEKLLIIGNKDILINLAKNQNLTELNINDIIEKGTFLARKNLIEYQNLNDQQKQRMIEIMNHHKSLYNDLIESIITI